MGNRRITRTTERHAEIYNEYERVLQQYNELYDRNGNPLKGIAPFLKRDSIFDIVAEKFKCSTEHVSRIVWNMTRSHKQA